MRFVINCILLFCSIIYKRKRRRGKRHREYTRRGALLLSCNFWLCKRDSIESRFSLSSRAAAEILFAVNKTCLVFFLSIAIPIVTIYIYIIHHISLFFVRIRPPGASSEPHYSHAATSQAISSARKKVPSHLLHKQQRMASTTWVCPSSNANDMGVS